ncbi:MAG: hypothetical protein PUP90_31460 [Nostoc sp. S4]|nr:hypothetical protein [Nostoc sp. S4]
MVSKPFSFRLPDTAVQRIEALQIEGETLNQTVQRIVMEHLGLSTEAPQSLYTELNTDADKRLEAVESTLAEMRSQLEELRGKLKAR